ncbi:MAG: phage tail assembly chaperone [Fimbriimonadaceae bacterium]|nr:phage tail assembly chaperone [Alphaproteobacteria bacterium]
MTGVHQSDDHAPEDHAPGDHAPRDHAPGEHASSERPPFPWRQVMGIAFGQLGLSPQAFWSMTPRELAAAFSWLEGGQGVAALSRPGLRDLMTQYPD